MGKHGFTKKEEDFIFERAPHEPISYIAHKLGVCTDKVNIFVSTNKIEKLPLKKRVRSIDYLCYQNDITEWEYYEIIDRSEHEPHSVIARDLGISSDTVHRFGNCVPRLPYEERVYTKNYSMQLFKITSNTYDEIVSLGEHFTVSSIIHITKCTEKCIKKVLYSNGIDELQDDVLVLPDHTIQHIPKEEIELIIQYYPHFTNKRLVLDYGVQRENIEIVVKHYSLEKLDKNKRLCIRCKERTRVGTRDYGSYCRECFTEMMIEYQKVYYPANKHRIPCRSNEVSMLQYIEDYK